MCLISLSHSQFGNVPRVESTQEFTHTHKVLVCYSFLEATIDVTKKRKTSSDPWRNIFKNPWEASFSLQQSSFQWDQKPWGHHQTPVAFALSSSHGKPLNIFPRLKTPPVMKWLSCRNFAPPMASHEAKTRQCLTTEWMGRKSMGMIEAIEDVYVIFTLTPSVEAVLQCVVLEKRIASG